MAELDGAFAVIGDVQFLPGYSLALTKTRGIDRLSDLPRAERLQFLADTDLIATAVENVCQRFDEGFRRINVEIQGNTDAFLHAHVWPRYTWEPAEVRGLPVIMHGVQRWHDPETALGPQHDALRAALTAEITALADQDGWGRVRA
ncbi:MAG: diadenosine tetraphosphate hydrolase [Microbacterium sp.]